MAQIGIKIKQRREELNMTQEELAKKLGYKTFIHEQNSIPGLSNKFLMHYVDKVGVSLPDSIQYFPKEKNLNGKNKLFTPFRVGGRNLMLCL